MLFLLDFTSYFFCSSGPVRRPHGPLFSNASFPFSVHGPEFLSYHDVAAKSNITDCSRNPANHSEFMGPLPHFCLRFAAVVAEQTSTGCLATHVWACPKSFFPPAGKPAWETDFWH